MKIKLVLCDIGNVLMLADHSRTIEAYILRYGIPRELAEQYFKRSDYTETGKGRMEWPAFCARLRWEWKVVIPDEKIFDIDGSHIYAVDLGLMQILETVMVKTPVVFVTNTRYSEWQRYIKLHPKIATEFVTWRSDMMGCYKNDPGVFARIVTGWLPRILSGTKVKPSQILFIDDSQGNCEAAAALGIQTFQYTEREPWLLAQYLSAQGLLC